MATKPPPLTQAQFRANARKLQAAGVLGKVDLRKRPTAAIKRKFTQYKDLLSGKAVARSAGDEKTARELRKKFGLKGGGNKVIIPRETKKEQVKIIKGEIKTTRPDPRGGTITKTYGTKFNTPRPVNAKAYYTIPSRRRGVGKLKRRTFASFDEMLFYLDKYDIDFEDIEDYIEVEEVSRGGPEDVAMHDKLMAERATAIKRATRVRTAKRRASGKVARRSRAKSGMGSRR